MILVELSHFQRSIVSHTAWRDRDEALKESVYSSVEYRNSYMLEVTEKQRTSIVEYAHERMNYMMCNSWQDTDLSVSMTYEYTQLEDISFRMFIACAE